MMYSFRSELYVILEILYELRNVVNVVQKRVIVTYYTKISFIDGMKNIN